MLTEHYDIYNNNYSTLDDEIFCLICHDKDSLQKHIKLNSNKYYLKKCKCDGYIHKKCLDIWYNLNMSCPYCLMKIEVKKSLLKEIINISFIFVYKVYVYYLINIIKIQGFVFVLFWFCFIYNVHLTFLNDNTFNNIYDNLYEKNNSFDKYTSNMKHYNLTN
jgi:hypothetical protein